MSEFSLIAASLPNFEEREGQVEMLKSCKKAYSQNSILLVEAGTGIGKSLAYLVAALTWEGEPTVIATHTIALQEQLFRKDIPLLLKALDIKANVVLMKGMQNYLCLRKLHDQGETPNALTAWAERTEEGTRSEYPFPHEVAAEAESCSHARCPHYQECFFFKAKRRAQEAQIVIVNHHLLFADLAIRASTNNYDQPCILPAFNRLIIDEAHHTEEVATEYFADRTSRQALLRFLMSALIKLSKLAKKIVVKSELTLVVEKREVADLVDELFNAFEEFVGQEEKRRITDLQHPLWVERIQPLVKHLLERGHAFTAALLSLEAREEGGLIADIKGLCMQLERHFSVLQRCVFQPLDREHVRWVEKNGTLVEARLEVAPLLKEALFDKLSTVILCSATLTTHGDFSFVKSRLGIEKAEEATFESPFDFEKQALLATCLDLPDPRDPSFTSRVSRTIRRIVEASKGNAFILFTSYQMLRECKAAWNLPYPLFCQGEQERTALLERFRQTEGAVLFGTDSFWEGVDVVGDQLRCVVLVKLPFRVPSDPLFQARSELLTERGESAFFHLALPQALLKFKQGFGRLIRHRKDRGAVVCLDSRLMKKGYGRSFLKSLPPIEVFAGKEGEVIERLERFFCDLHCSSHAQGLLMKEI